MVRHMEIGDGDWTRICDVGHKFSDELHKNSYQNNILMARQRLINEPRLILRKEVWDSLLHLLRFETDRGKRRAEWALNAMAQVNEY